MQDKEKKEFWFILVGLLLFVGTVSYFSQDNKEEDFQAYLEQASPTARAVDFNDAVQMERSIRGTRGVQENTQQQVIDASNGFLQGNQKRAYTQLENDFINALNAQTTSNIERADQLIFARGAYVFAEQETGLKKMFINALSKRGGN